MSLFKTEIKEKEASGQIAEAYKFLKDTFGKVPNVMQLHTVSPHLFANLMDFLGYYSKKSKVDIEMLALIRLLVSSKGNCMYCVKLNSAILIHIGKKQEKIDKAVSDWNAIEMDDKRKQLVLFALKLTFNDKKVCGEDISGLKALGWSEQDIYDACAAATKQLGVIQLIKGFKVEIDF